MPSYGKQVREYPDSAAAPAAERTGEIDAIHEIIDGGLLRIAFQPILDMKTRRVFAYEALARSPLPLFESIPHLFRCAVRAGRVGELGRLHRAQAIKACRDWPLFINIHPNELDQPFLVRPDDPIFWHRQPVYLEITESAPLLYFEQCHNVLAELRKKGIHVAIDDLGAGYSNLRYISDLEPDIVKLDRELVAGIREGSRLYQLTCSLVGLCKEMGARVVAEGIETVPELAAVKTARVDFSQGYLLGRPGLPPPRPHWPAAL